MQMLKNITPRQISLSVIGLGLFLGSLFLVQAVVLSWCLTPLPGIATSGCGANDDPQFSETHTGIDAPPELPTPLPALPESDLPPAWDGASRINILLLGVDASDAEDRQGPARSDTMIVVTIDPQTKTAGMLSIPRDMWVNIPGFDYGKINTAYYLGDANRLPGGGPALASRTVEQFLGIPIHYYAQVEFWTFIYLVDQLGGVIVEVEKNITVDPIGPGPDDRFLGAGPQRMDGMIALAYARARNTEGGDVDRARRTQEVIIAIRNKALDPANFPNLILSAPAIYEIVQSGIRTNMPLDDAIELAVLMRDIPLEDIKRGVINFDMVTLQSSPDGLSIFKPIPDKIRELRDEIFTTGGPASPLASGADLGDLMRQEGATVIIRNGTFTAGLGQTTAQFLIAQGVNVIGADNANETPAVTRIIDHRGKPYALRYFQQLFGLSSSGQIVSQYDPNAPADIEIILGNDWAVSNPMP